MGKNNSKKYAELTLCLLGNFACFLSSVDFFQNQLFLKNSIRNTSLSALILSYTIRVSNSLDPDQARHLVGPDLGPNCLQRLSADNTGRQRFSIPYMVE